MIKRIKDDDLSKVNGGSQSETICACPIVCTCKGKQDARIQAKWPQVEFRNTKKL